MELAKIKMPHNTRGVKRILDGLVAKGRKKANRGVSMFLREFEKDYPVEDADGNKYYVPAGLNKTHNLGLDSNPKSTSGEAKYIVPFYLLKKGSTPTEVEAESATLKVIHRESGGIHVQLPAKVENPKIKYEQEKPVEDFVEVEPKEYEDSNLSHMTLRDRACIDLGLPESNKPWLNDMIRRSPKFK